MPESNIPITIGELREAIEFMTTIRTIYDERVPELPDTISNAYPPARPPMKARYGECLVAHYLDRQGEIVEVKGGSNNPDIIASTGKVSEVKSISTDAGWNRLQSRDCIADELFCVDWRPALNGASYALIHTVNQEGLEKGRVDFNTLEEDEPVRFDIFENGRKTVVVA